MDRAHRVNRARNEERRLCATWEVDREEGEGRHPHPRQDLQPQSPPHRRTANRPLNTSITIIIIGILIMRREVRHRVACSRLCHLHSLLLLPVRDRSRTVRSSPRPCTLSTSLPPEVSTRT